MNILIVLQNLSEHGYRTVFERNAVNLNYYSITMHNHGYSARFNILKQDYKESHVVKCLESLREHLDNLAKSTPIKGN